MGCVASAAMMIYAGNALPTGLLLVLMFVCSFIAGGIWGIIPAFFKARWNTNETLFTLMLNYVAMQVVTFALYTGRTRQVLILLGSLMRQREQAGFHSCLALIMDGILL